MTRTALLPILAIAALSAMGQAQTFTSFDSITGVTRGFGGASTNRQLMGQAFNFGNTTGAQSVTGFDIILGSFAAQAYTDLQLQVTFFDTYTPGGATTAAAFSNPIATFDIDFGAQNLALNTIYAFGGNGFTSANPATPGITFSAPVNFSSSTNKGVQFLWRGNTGSGLVATNNLTTAIRGAAADATSGAAAEGPFAVGSGASGAAPSFGYFRNASNAAPTTSSASLLNSDGRQIGDNSGLAFRLYSTPSAVPEPATMAALGLGAAALLRRRRKSA